MPSGSVRSCDNLRPGASENLSVKPDRGRSNGNVYVEFEQVGKSFDGRTLVVRDLDLRIRKGEFLTLLGPSGSGKTTCLMMLAGFETPTSGAIRINGRSMHQVPPHQRGIGMVFQNYALFPHMTVGRQPVVPAGGARTRCAAPPRPGERRAAARAARRAGTSPAGPTVRWPEAARGDRSGAGVRAGPRADGRAAGRARPASARSVAASS